MKDKKLQLFAVFFGHFMNDIYMNLIIPIAFAFSVKLGLNYSEQALIGSVIIAAGSFAQPVIGHVVDRKGRPELLIFSVLWIGILMSISGLVDNYYLLLLIVGLGALASALYHPLGASAVIHLVDKSKGMGLSMFITVGGFAVGLAPLMVIPLVSKWGLNYLVIFIAPAIVAAGLMTWCKVQKIDLAERNEKTESVSDKINREKLKWILGMLYVSTVRSLIFRSFLLVFGVQLLFEKGMGSIQAGFVITAYMWITSIGTLSGGHLSDRFGNKLIFNIANALTLLGLAALVYGSDWMGWIAFLTLGLASGLANTPNIILTQEMIPKSTSLVTGLIMGLGGGLGGVAMYFYGKIADGIGLLEATFYLIVPFLLVCILVVLVPVYKAGIRE